ncbi:MAG: F0F1 ATP synthase subunit B [bacterium]
MNELITTFHIDWKLMVAQLVNFGLVLGILYWLAAKPLSKLMKDRTKEITDGLDNAKLAESEVQNANIKKEEIVREAKVSAKKIISISQADGKEMIKEAKDKATLEKEEIIKQARLDAEKEKKNSDEQVRREASALVAEGVKKVVESYVAQGKGDELIRGMLHK